MTCCCTQTTRCAHCLRIHNRTLQFYNAQSEHYAQWSRPKAPHPRLIHWLAKRPTGAKLLDLGCGNGWAAAEMIAQGFDATALDASVGLAEQAKKMFGITVLVQDMRDLNIDQRFDGIWAFFSLLHSPRTDFSLHLTTCYRALRPDGVLYFSLIRGDGQAVDPEGRAYTYYQPDCLINALAETGFIDITVDRGPGKNYDGSPTENLYFEARRDG